MLRVNAQSLLRRTCGGASLSLCPRRALQRPLRRVESLSRGAGSSRLLGVATLSLAATALRESNAQCDAALYEEPVVVSLSPSLSLSVAQREGETALSALWDSLCAYYHAAFESLDLLARWLFLCFAFSPAAVTAPLLLLSPAWQDRWWHILRESVTRSGPCFIKFAQWISTRPDLFPAVLCEQLAALQSSPRAVPAWEEVEPVLVAHYGPRWHDTLRLDRDALTGAPVVVGGGAIAQVLKGRIVLPRTKNRVHSNQKNSRANSRTRVNNIAMKNNDNNNNYSVYSSEGEEEQSVEVAVKITHPGVKRVIARDIALMTRVTALLERLVPSLQQVSLCDSVDVFAELMLRQVDMQFEAQNLERLIENFHQPARERERGARSLRRSDSERERESVLSTLCDKVLRAYSRLTERHALASSSPSALSLSAPHAISPFNVRFPQPYEWLCNEDVLVEDFEDGVLMRDHITQCSTEQKKRIAEIGMDAVFKMVFLDNFVHADLHPGNIILHDPENLQLSLIDAGLVVSLSPVDRVNLIDLFHAVVRNDGYAVGEMMIQRSRNRTSVVDAEGFCRGIDAIVDRVHKSGFALGKIGVNEILQRVFLLCYQHQVKLETRFASVMVAIGVVEGLGRQLDPDIDILKRLAPFVMRAALMGR